MQRRHIVCLNLALCLLAVLGVPQETRADKSLAGKACRSVHLGYPAPAGEAFYCEVQVKQSAPGSYFMVCGWNTGYFGIQEIGPEKKVVIFSVWDAARGNNPDAVDDDVRVRVLHANENVRVSRFGGEGTGGKCMMDLDWKIGATYRCLVTAKPDGQRTRYAGYLYLPEKKEWLHLVTFSTVTGGQHLRGYYSFVEDFHRDGDSARQARRAQFGNGWVRDKDENWLPLTRARFTGDSNPATNIDAGTDGAMYYLATGGETKNRGVELGATMELPPESVGRRPEDLP